MEGVCDDGMDISGDDLDEVLNMLGDVDLDDLKDELLVVDYILIQFSKVQPDFSLNIAFTLPTIFKANWGKPSSFDDDF